MWAAIGDAIAGLVDKYANWKTVVILFLGTGFLTLLVTTGWLGAIISYFFGELLGFLLGDAYGSAFFVLLQGCYWVNWLYGFPIISYTITAFLIFLRVSLGLGYFKFLLWLAEKFS